MGNVCAAVSGKGGCSVARDGMSTNTCGSRLVLNEESAKAQKILEVKVATNNEWQQYAGVEGKPADGHLLRNRGWDSKTLNVLYHTRQKKLSSGHTKNPSLRRPSRPPGGRRPAEGTCSQEYFLYRFSRNLLSHLNPSHGRLWRPSRC